MPDRRNPPALTIGLVGCGKMGGALLQGWLAADMNAIFYVLEPNGFPAFLTPSNSLHLYTDAKSLHTVATTLDFLILAVKPQVMEAVCAELQPAITPKTAILSIAAGQTLGAFARRFGANQPLIRAMPNTPAAIGQGITVAIANSHVTPAQKTQAHALLAVAGLVEWLDDENLMDAVTALSGSGPAYVFYLIEVLAAAGIKNGLPAALATTLARQTVIGSAALAAHEPATASTLRENVTSPGGTTAAALKILQENNELQTLFDRALAAAAARGRELNA